MIDRYDAPDGYVAVRGETLGCCDGCAFFDITTRRTCADTNGCMKNDDEDVIFKSRADFEKMLMQEIERFYGKGKVKRIIFTKVNATPEKV